MRRRHFIQNIATATAAVGLTAPTELLGEMPPKPKLAGPSPNDPLNQRPVSGAEQALLDEVGKEMGRDFDAAVIQAMAEDGLVSKTWVRNKLGL